MIWCPLGKEYWPIGSVAKLYRRKGPLIYEEIRKYLTIYED